jgi:ubiquinone/menaquinone biosynthesis C-methylase UbiE
LAARSGSAKPERSGFYRETLEALIAEGALSREMTVLVVCGGAADAAVFRSLGFTEVTISNLDAAEVETVHGYRWQREDAEDLSCGDEEYDLVAVSAGLHHCRSPHRALLEMYRVARRAVFVLESRDSALMRLAVRLGFGDEYEWSAVAAHGCGAGGVRNTSVPNYVYRWTEREVEKTIASNAPQARHRIRFFHSLEIPLSVLDRRRHAVWGIAGRLLQIPLWIVGKVAPREANMLAFVVFKPEVPGDLQPWMTVRAGEVVLDEPWIRSRAAAPPEDPDGG